MTRICSSKTERDDEELVWCWIEPDSLEACGLVGCWPQRNRPGYIVLNIQTVDKPAFPLGLRPPRQIMTDFGPAWVDGIRLIHEEYDEDDLYDYFIRLASFMTTWEDTQEFLEIIRDQYGQAIPVVA